MIRLKSYFMTSLFLITAVTLSCFVGCGTNTTEADQEIDLPESDLNFTEHIHPLFLQKCSRCHSSFEPEGNLDLTDYQSIESHYIDGNVPLMIKGDGQNSFLYNILLGPLLDTPRMPYNEAPLSANYIVAIRQWIDEGAPQFP